MAKAKVVKSVRGNDLITLTLGPKETAKLAVILEPFMKDAHVSGVYDALGKARARTKNRKAASISLSLGS